MRADGGRLGQKRNERRRGLLTSGETTRPGSVEGCEGCEGAKLWRASSIQGRQTRAPAARLRASAKAMQYFCSLEGDPADAELRRPPVALYRTTQQPEPSPFSNVKSAARVAASNTSSTPSPLRLEHSRYLLAPTSRAATSPSWGVTNRSDFFRISSIATGSSRRSFFRPTRIIGTPAQRREASSIH